MHNGVIILAFYTASRSMRMAPIGALFPCPPLCVIVEIDSVIRRVEYQRRGPQETISGLRCSRRQLLFQLIPITFLLGSCYIARRLYQFCQLSNGHFGAIYTNNMNRYLM